MIKRKDLLSKALARKAALDGKEPVFSVLMFALSDSGWRIKWTWDGGSPLISNLVFAQLLSILKY